MVSKQWYVYKDQQQKGPLTWEQLWQQARSGALGPEDYVWTEGMDGWTRGKQISGLFPRPAPVPPPPPPPQEAQAVPPPPPAPAGQAEHLGPGASTFEQGAPGPYPAPPAKRRSRGWLIALIVILLGGGYFAYTFLFNIEPDVRSIIGSWHGVDDYGGDTFVQFNEDGTLQIAFPLDGYWTAIDYRIEEENHIYYVEIYVGDYDDNWEDWGQFLQIEFIEDDKLLATEPYYDTGMELTLITDRQFQNVIDQLRYSDPDAL